VTENKNTGFIIILAIYTVLFVADVATTWYNGLLLPVLELNPLYSLLPSLIPIILLNLAVIIVLYWLYCRKQSTPTTRYIIISLMIMTIFMRCIALYNASKWMPLTHAMHTEYNLTQNQQIIMELNNSITPVVKSAEQKFYALLIYAPMFYAIICHLIWKIDHKTEKK